MKKAYKLVRNESGKYTSYRAGKYGGVIGNGTRLEYIPGKWKTASINVIFGSQFDLFIFFDLELWITSLKSPFKREEHLEIWEIKYKGYSELDWLGWSNNCKHMAKSVKLIRKVC